MKGKKVLYRLPRTVVDEETGRRISLNELEIFNVPEDKEFQMNGAKASKVDINNGGKFTSEKDVFVSINPTFYDDFISIKRNAQIITRKDVGAIIANTGITRESIVIDAGAGSGSLSCFLGEFVKRVDCFDVDERSLKTTEENITNLNLSNVFLKEGDIYKENNFKENEYDLFTLDVPEPHNAMNTAKKVLKIGGFLVVYCPSIHQIQQAVLALPDGFIHEKTIEVIEREWSVKEKVLRPVTKDFGHTAFLTFARKIY